ncbi:hypothetical protein TNCV_4887591 [Trichonephila clavipes]|nr:hypothetical protein TNCV_4887591 [Trichonephila clavipes]
MDVKIGVSAVAVEQLSLRSPSSTVSCGDVEEQGLVYLEREVVLVLTAPRKAAAAHFRLLTGHDCLRSHLYRIVFTDSPDCTLCDSDRPMTAEHLVVCPALINLNSTIERY